MVPCCVYIGSHRGDFEIARTEETVATADLAALDVGNGERNDVCAKEGDEPAQGAYEVNGLGAPDHALREAQGQNDVFQDIRQETGCFGADGRNVGIDVAIFYDEVFDGDFLAASKAHSSLGRFAFGVEGDLDGRSFIFSRYVGLFFRYAGNEEGNTARCAEGADGCIGNIGGIQFLCSQVFYLAENGWHIMGRDFFRADFQQYVFTHLFSSFSIGNPNFSRCSR